MKKWLRAQPVQPTTIAELQALLDTFHDHYNEQRPHRSLPQRSTPATAYTARPKATPSADRSSDTHDRVRTDRVDEAGSVTLRVNSRLHHIVNAATGELLRELTIDPTRDYQPTGAPNGPTHPPTPQ